MLAEARSFKYTECSVDLAHSLWESFICKIDFSVLLFRWVFQNVAQIDLAGLEASLCDTWLSVLSVKQLHSLKPMLNQLDSLRASGFSRNILSWSITCSELLSEPLLFIPLELIKHLLLCVQELDLFPLLFILSDSHLRLIKFSLSLLQFFRSPYS